MLLAKIKFNVRLKRHIHFFQQKERSENENVENVSFEIVCFENIDNYSLNYISEKLVEVTFKTNDCENHFIEIMCSYLHNGEVQQYSKNIFIYTDIVICINSKRII